eukprot:1645684-Karenia_brevis.AAC.1
MDDDDEDGDNDDDQDDDGDDDDNDKNDNDDGDNDDVVGSVHVQIWALYIPSYWMMFALVPMDYQVPCVHASEHL